MGAKMIGSHALGVADAAVALGLSLIGVGVDQLAGIGAAAVYVGAVVVVIGFLLGVMEAPRA